MQKNLEAAGYYNYTPMFVSIDGTDPKIKDIVPSSNAAADLSGGVIVLYKLRAAKLSCRVATLVCGGAESNGSNCMMKPVTNLKELDANEAVGDEAYVMMGMINGMTKAGVLPPRRMTYKQACKAGVAPSPTNDIQKAIWDEVHSIPQKPIKIEFDPKKGR